jgi:hypothetical protein
MSRWHSTAMGTHAFPGRGVSKQPPRALATDQVPVASCTLITARTALIQDFHPGRRPTEQVLQLFIGAVNAQARYLDKLIYGSAARVLAQQWPVPSPARCLWFHVLLLTRSASNHQRWAPALRTVKVPVLLGPVAWVCSCSWRAYLLATVQGRKCLMTRRLSSS